MTDMNEFVEESELPSYSVEGLLIEFCESKRSINSYIDCIELGDVWVNADSDGEFYAVDITTAKTSASRSLAALLASRGLRVKTV